MFNKEMLILARELRGYTQKELAEQLNGVSQGHLSKLEMGIHEISDDILKQLMNILELPKSFFYQEKQHYGLPLSINGNFRKKQSLSKKVFLQIKGKINIIIYNIEDLLLNQKTFKSKLLDIKVPYQASNNYDGETKDLNVSDKKSIKNRVLLVKEILNISKDTPIINLVEHLEKNNILVIDVDFETELVDGFSYWIDDIPVIFVSRKITGDRQRFTISHELAHLILHKDNPTERMEKEADYFASEFLMPEKGISDDLSYITLERLAMLKNKWKVSMSSLLMKTKELGNIKEYAYRGLFINMAKLGYRKVEPVSIDYEHPTFIKKLVSDNKDKLNINEKDRFILYGIE
jgi:Zn-dependent peptidase ImmA (M78 family)